MSFTDQMTGFGNIQSSSLSYDVFQACEATATFVPGARPQLPLQTQWLQSK